MKIDNWLEIIYKEDDFSRGLATTLSGTVGLSVYLYLNDITISVFSLIISFPIFRLLASFINSWWIQKAEIKAKEIEMNNYFSSFSTNEKEVIKEFVRQGGSVLSFNLIDDLSIFLPKTGVNSLENKELLKEDFLNSREEGLILDTDVYNKALQLFKEELVKEELEEF